MPSSVTYIAAMAKYGTEMSMPPEISTVSTPSAMMPVITLARSRLKMLPSCQADGLMRPITTTATTTTSRITVSDRRSSGLILGP